MKIFTFLIMMLLTLFVATGVMAATITTAGSGNWNSTTVNAPWPLGTVPLATDNVIIAATHQVTVTAAASITNLTLNATTSRLTINSGQTITVSGTFSNSGTTTNGVVGPGTILFTGTATFGSLTPTGTRPNVTVGNGVSTNTVTIGANTLVANLTVSANATLTNTTFTVGLNQSLVVNGTLTAGTGVYTMSGATQTISGTNTIVIPSLTISGTTTNNGTLTVSTALAGASTLTNGTNATLNFGGASITPTLTATASGNTVNYNRTNTQTVKGTTYNNLTLSGTSAKTTTGVTVNGILSMEGNGTVTASAAPTYGASATLQYNRGTAQNAGVEWRTPFTATGGVIIANTGAITMNAAKVFNASVPLTINSGATLAMSTFLLTLNGNFVNNGGTTSGSGGVTITGTATQSIGAFTTTGLVSMTKASGTATFQGNVNGAGLTINGAGGGILNLGTGLTHTFTGVVTLTAGTLNGGSSILNENMVSTTAWNGTGTVFSAGTGTVKFGAAGNQTLSATTTTFNNLTLSNSGIKTFTNANTVNGILSMEGTATATLTGALTYGAAATLQYNTATARNAGAEWLATFPAAGTSTGGVIIANTGTITLNAAKVVNAPLTINSGASLNTSAANNYQLTFGDNFVNNGGTFTANASPIVIANTKVTQSIGAFTTTGLVSMTKASGTATFQGNVNGAGLTINGAGGGILNLGTGLTHTFTGVVTLTAGTLNGGSSILNENMVSTTAWNGTGTVFSAGTGTVNFGAAGNQTLSATTTTFNNLTLSNSGIKTFTNANTVNGILSMEGTATASAAPTYGSSAALQYQGSSAQTTGTEFTTPWAGSGGVIINNANGVVLNGDKTINSILTLTSGNITTGSYTLTIGSSGSVSRTSGYIIGNLQKGFSTGAQSFTFDIGDATNYTPIALSFANVTGTGNVLANTMGSEHTNIATSGLNSDKDVNRYWTLTAGGGITYSTYNATFTFAAGDIDGGASTGTFIVRRYDGTWHSTTTGTRTGTTTQATGITSMSDFVIGESASGTPKTLAEAISLGWVGGTAYIYDGSEFVIYLYDDTTDIPPWSGFFIAVKQNVNILFPEAVSPPPVTSPSTKTLASGIWYLISSPLASSMGGTALDNLSSLSGLLSADNTGTSSSDEWRIYKRGYTDGLYYNANSDGFLPGRGFFIKHFYGTNKDISVSGSGATGTNGYYELKLPITPIVPSAITYHQVGNPYWYNIKWSECKFSQPIDELNPLGKVTTTLSTDAIETCYIRLELVSNDGLSRDTYNRAGIILTEGGNQSFYNASELMPPEPYVSLSLTDPSNPGRGAFAYDYRTVGQDVYTWNLNLGTSYESIDSQLSMKEFINVPEWLDFNLTNSNTGESYNITGETTIPVSLAKGTVTTFILTATRNEHSTAVDTESPQAFGITSIQPNPFNPSTTINFNLTVSGTTKVSIYNLNGQLVDTLVNEQMKPGYHKVVWNASRYSSGVYIVVVESKGKKQTRKITLMK